LTERALLWLSADQSFEEGAAGAPGAAEDALSRPSIFITC